MDMSMTADRIATKLMADLKAGKLKAVGIDEVRDAIADEIFPAELGAFLGSQLEQMTLRKLVYKTTG